MCTFRYATRHIPRSFGPRCERMPRVALQRRKRARRRRGPGSATAALAPPPRMPAPPAGAAVGGVGAQPEFDEWVALEDLAALPAKCRVRPVLDLSEPAQPHTNAVVDGGERSES